MSHASHHSGGTQAVRFRVPKRCVFGYPSGAFRIHQLEKQPSPPPSLLAPSGRVTPLAPPTCGASPQATLRVGDGPAVDGPIQHHTSMTPHHSIPNPTLSQSRSHFSFPPCSVSPPPHHHLTTTPTPRRPPRSGAWRWRRAWQWRGADWSLDVFKLDGPS